MSIVTGATGYTRYLLARPFIPAPQTVRISLQFRQNTTTVYNVIYVKVGHVVTVADFTRLHTSLLGWITNSQWTLSHNAGMQYVGCHMTGLDTLSGPEQDFIEAAPIPGASGDTNQVAANASVVIRLNTGLAGRSQRGRIYDAQLLTTFQTGNQLNATGITRFNTCYNGLIANLAAGAATDKLSVVSFRSGGAWRVVAQVLPVISISVNPRIGTQRRRLP